MLAYVLAAAGLLLALAALAWYAEIQTTVAVVVDRGGLWLEYSTGLGRWRLTGFQARMMADRRPRAWMRTKTGKLVQVDFDETVRAMLSRKKKPLHITLRSAWKIGAGIIVRELSVYAKLGVENDAAATALLCGAVLSVLQTLRSAGTRGEFKPRGSIEVRPVFNRARLSVRFKCILAIKARHIIREIIESYAGRKHNGKPPD